MDWLKRSWLTLKEAVGLRWGLVLGLAPLVFGYLAKTDRISSVDDLLPNLVALIAGALTSLFALVVFIINYATRLRTAAEPKLKVSFASGHETKDLIGNVPDRMTGQPLKRKCRFVRFQVENIQPGTTARGCRAFIRRIGRVANGSVDDRLGQTQPLRWAEQVPGQSEDEIDIPSDARIFSDLFSADEVYNKVFVKWRANMIVNEAMFDEPGQYKLEVFVDSRDGRSEPAEFLLDWRGQWNDFDIKLTPKVPSTTR